MNQTKTARNTWSRTALCILLLAYSPLCIVLPIYRIDASYAVSTLFLFWIPVLIMLIVNTRWMYRKNLLLPFLSSVIVMTVVTLYFEYAALGTNAWFFSEEHHQLLKTTFNNPGFPFALYGAPIEEFMFWFGAPPFCILLYITFERVMRKKDDVTHELLLAAAWPMMMVPFFPLIGWLGNRLKRKQAVYWPAMAMVLIFCFFSLVSVEHNALIKGHWFYNTHRILGLKVLGIIPAEEILYYTLGPLFVVLLFNFFNLRPLVLLRDTSKTNDIKELARRTSQVARRAFRVIRLPRGKAGLPPPNQPVPSDVQARGSAGWDDSESPEKLAQALLERRFHNAQELVEALTSDLQELKRPIPAKTAAKVLALLRRYAWFEPLYNVADIIRANGQCDPEVLRQRAQALIEQGRITEAIEELIVLRNELEIKLVSSNGNAAQVRNELGEAIGLLGRAYKQLYVNANPRSGEPRIQDLERSIECYGGAYRRRLGDFLWHGINYIALITHAVRVQQADPTAFSSEAQRQALAILEEIENRKARENLHPWDLANRIESFLALGKNKEAREAAKEYLQHGEIDAFMVQGTNRQLVQLWNLSEAISPGREILPMMTARFAELGGLHEEIVLLPEKYDEYERILNETHYLSMQFLLSALRSAKSVARIGPGRNTVWGTGFLMSGAWLNNGSTHRNLFLTNAHVCSSSAEAQKRLPRPVAPNDYWVLFQDFSGPANHVIPVKVLRELWTSPPSELDATLLEIGPPPSGAQPLGRMSPPPMHVGLGGHVNIVGHPRGMDLRISLQNNELVDIRNPYIYYRTSTETGSSGSPVFDLNWNVVALHQGANGIKMANVGVRMDTIVDAIKKSG